MTRIRLNPVASRLTREAINGVDYFVAPSPYFVPKRLEARYEPSDRSFHIDLKYLDNEVAAAMVATKGKALEVRVGRHSKRVLSVLLRVDRGDLARIKAMLTEEVPQAIRVKAEQSPGLAEHYRVAARAITDHTDSITRELAEPAIH